MHWLLQLILKQAVGLLFKPPNRDWIRSSTLNRFIKYNNFWWIAVVGLWGNQLIYKSSILIAEIKVEMFFLEIRHFWYIILHKSGYMKDKLVWVPEQKQCSIHIIIYNTYKSLKKHSSEKFQCNKYRKNIHNSRSHL